MSILLQTSRGTDIVNDQITEVSAYERNWAATLAGSHRTIRGAVSGTYNCHGLTFASRRTRLWDPPSINVILGEDDYVEIGKGDTLPGDVIVYYNDDGDITHSGIVVQNPPMAPATPIVVSKWGNGPELIHRYWDVHPIYGTRHRFFRCSL